MKNLNSISSAVRTKWQALLVFLFIGVPTFAQGQQTLNKLNQIFAWFIPIAALYLNFRFVLAIIKIVKRLTDDEDQHAKQAAYKQIALFVTAIVVVNLIWVVLSDWGFSFKDALEGND